MQDGVINYWVTPSFITCYMDNIFKKLYAKLNGHK
jgi:hypothetical protein